MRRGDRGREEDTRWEAERAQPDKSIWQEWKEFEVVRAGATKIWLWRQAGKALTDLRRTVYLPSANADYGKRYLDHNTTPTSLLVYDEHFQRSWPRLAICYTAVARSHVSLPSAWDYLPSTDAV